MNKQIIGKLYDKQTFSNFYKIQQWQFLSSFNTIQSASLDQQGFIKNFQLGSEKLISWFFENLDWKIPNLDYILEKIISRFAHVQQLGHNQDLENPIKQKIWKIHDKVSDYIIVLAKELFPTLSLDLGRKYPSLKKEVNYQTLSIPIQIRKFGNLIIFVIQALKFYTKFRLYHKGNLTIHSNYIQSIIKIACSLMLSFQQLIQNNEPIHNEANQLTLIIINLLDIYFQYDKQLKQYRQRIRKEKNKSKNKLKNLKYKKKRRILRKKIQAENQNESNLIEEIGQNKQKKSKKKTQKRKGPISADELRAQSSVFQSNPQRSLKKIKSIVNLHGPEKSIKKHSTIKKSKKSKKSKIPLSNYFTEYLKIVFEVASNHAFLKTKTLQTMLKLINFIINPRNSKETSNIIQLAPEELIKSLFKVKVKDRTNEGLFYQLCQFGVFLLSINHINFDLQLSIKRLFFDNLPKKEIQLKEFFEFCNFNQLKADIKTVNRLVEIIVKQPEHDKQNQKIKNTPKQTQKKPELQRPEILSEKKFGQSSAKQLSNHEESQKSNIKILPFKLDDVFKYVNNSNAYVRLQKNCQFGQFNSQLPNKQEKPKRKQSGNQEDRNNQLRTVFKFVPQGNVQFFINETIENIVRICFRELKDIYLKTNNLFMQPDSQKQQHLFQLDAFNLSVLIKSLQVMGRYSPSLTAYIYRFKLNKIVSEQYQRQSISKELKEKINMILYQKIQPPKDDSSAPQVTFYTFLMRIIMPFSTSFGSALIFEMCLDNLPLVQIPDKVVSLGHIIRIKTINQLKKGILNKQSIIRKFCSLTLLTGLLSIRQFAICCFEAGMQHFLQEQYVKILQKTNLFKQVINPYFIKPLQLLQELSVYLYLQKKTNKPPITKIKLLRGLDSNNLKNQLISKNCLGKLKDKFYHSWPFSQIGQTIEGQGDDDQDQLSNDSILSDQEQQDSNLSLSIFSNPHQDFIEQNPELQNQSGNSWVIHQPLSNDEQMMPEDMSDQNINIQELQNLPIDQVILQGISDNIDEENIQNQEDHSLLDEQDMLQGHSQSFEENLSDFDEINEEDQFQNDSQDEILSPTLADQNILKFMGQDKDLYEQFEEIIVSSEKLNNLQPISQAITQQVKILHCCFKLKDTPNTHPKFNELHKQFSDVLKFIESNDVYFNECKQITFKHFVMIQNLTYARPVQGPISLSFDEDDPYYKAPQSFGLENFSNRRLPRNGFIRIAAGQIDPSGHRIIRLDRLNLGQLRQDFIHSRPPTMERNPQRNERNEQEDQEQEQRNAREHQNFVVRINNQGPTLMEVLGDNNQNFPPQLIAQTGMSEAQFNNLPRTIQQQIIEQLNLRQLYGDQYMNEINGENPQINQMDEQLEDDIENQQNGSEQQHLSRENMNQLIEEQSENIQHIRNLGQNNMANQIMMQVPQQENQNNHIIKKMLKENPKLDEYFKLANQYKKRVDKDLFFILNNKGKKNHKFHCYSDEFLENFLYLVYFLDQSTYIEFPYRLLENLLIHTDNSEKILSTLLQILKLGPKIKLQSSFKIKGCIPTTIIMGSNNQLIDSYQQLGYSKLALKIIHLFSILSNHFSISSRMLQFQNNPINSMKKVMALVQQKQQQQDNNFLQNFIGLLEFEQISDDQVTFSFFIDTLRNITHNNYLNSCTQFFQKQKTKYLQTKKKQKKKKQKTNEEIKDAIEQQIKQEQIDSYQLLYNDPKLLLSKKSIKLLCEVLLKEELKFNSHIVSKIIIRFCSNIDNLKEFIANFKRMIDEKAQQEIQNLSKMKNPEYVHQLNANIQQSKIVSILTVLGQILKVVSHQKSQSQNICEQFLSIISSKSLRKMCEIGLDLISVQNSHTQLANKISQVLDSFVIIYKMISDVTKTGQQQVIQSSKKIIQIQNVSQSTPKLKQKSNSKIILEDFDMQSLWQNKICTPLGRIFINSLIKKKIRSTMKSIKNSKMSIFDIPIVSMAIKTPHMLQFDNKKALFKVQMYRVNRRHYGSLDLYIRRDQVFQQSFTQIMSRRPQQLKGKINIKFENEPGQDAGGLSREWFQLLSKQMFNPNYALFKPSSAGNTYQPSPISYVNNDHLLYFKFIGKIMGKALSDGFMLDAYFTPAFYKHLLGLPITYLDMQEEDFEFYNSLKWILDKNNCPIQDYIQLYFAHEVDNLGEIVTKELIPNGSQIKVTENNKMQYVQQITKYKMVQAVKNQYQALLSGFHQFIPSKIVKIFEPKELQLMISGLPTIDISDLKKNTDLRINARTDNVIIWLFEALEEFDMQLRAAFVQFVTGTSKVPVDGFKALRGVNGPQKFNIQKIYERNTFPRAHTCFNQLDLPEYDTKQILVKKLTEAIISGKQGFGFD